MSAQDGISLAYLAAIVFGVAVIVAKAAYHAGRMSAFEQNRANASGSAKGGEAMSGERIPAPACVDCAHYWRRPSGYFPLPPNESYHACIRRPDKFDLVLGRVADIRNAPEERASQGGDCGPFGRYFTPKPSAPRRWWEFWK